jgi:hypothetical protein
MQPTVINFSDSEIDAGFDVKKISFSPVRANPKVPGARSVFMNYDGMQPILTSPTLVTPFGVGDYEGNSKFAMQVVLKDDTLLSALRDIENKVKQTALAEPKWFNGKKLSSMEIVENNMTPGLKTDKMGNTIFTVKIPYDIEKKTWGKLVILEEVYGEDENGEKIIVDHKQVFPDPENPAVTPLDLIRRNTSMEIAFKSNGLWFTSRGFGYSWLAEQILIKSKPSELAAGVSLFKLKAGKPASLKRSVSESQDSDEPEGKAAGGGGGSRMQSLTGVSSATLESDDEEK